MSLKTAIVNTFRKAPIAIAPPSMAAKILAFIPDPATVVRAAVVMTLAQTLIVAVETTGRITVAVAKNVVDRITSRLEVEAPPVPPSIG